MRVDDFVDFSSRFFVVPNYERLLRNFDERQEGWLLLVKRFCQVIDCFCGVFFAYEQFWAYRKLRYELLVC